ncbi:MAG: nicotinate-nucleotide--dimethylbenzimidazole phosphoribosyltransferase [Intestinimonas sp.]
MTGSPNIDILPGCGGRGADNGVVEEGVTQTGQEVTAIVTENMSTGDTSVCRMSHVAGADADSCDTVSPAR